MTDFQSRDQVWYNAVNRNWTAANLFPKFVNVVEMAAPLLKNSRVLSGNQYWRAKIRASTPVIQTSLFQHWSEVNSLSCVRLFVTQNSPGQNTGVGSLSLLQGIFPIQGLNPGLPHCRQILHKMSHKRSPRILKWVAYLFSSGPSWPRNWTGVCCIAGRLFTSWTTREAHHFMA